MSVYIFLGPTLPVEEARKILDAHYLPPVIGGDVQQLMARSPRAIGIIDGLFEQTTAVFHKEILYALSKGVHVFGASSMGALRAAELHTFGMVGVGRIFEWFRSGELEDDDEVAVNHGTADQGYASISEAMVNLREGLERARDAHVISPTTHDALLKAAKATFYVNRSWKHLFHVAPGVGVTREEVQALRDFVTRERPNLKRDDALRLLTKMSGERVAQAPLAAPSFTFEPSSFWKQIRDDARTSGLYVDREVRDHQQDPPVDAFDLHARLFSKDPQELLRQSLFYFMTELVSTWLGLAVDEDEIDLQIERMGLKTKGVPQQAVRLLAKFEALAQNKIPTQAGVSLDRYLPLALLRGGRLSSTIDRVRHQWEWLRVHSLEQPSMEAAGINQEQLLAWYRARSGLEAPSLEDYAEALEVDEHGFVTELLRVYMYEKREQKASS